MKPSALACLLFAALPLRGQQSPPAATPSRPVAAPQSTTVTSAEPLPLDAPDRSVRSFVTNDPASLPLFGSAVDFLRLDPSLTLEERSPAGVQADLSIRGTTFEQTLILVDGLRLNDPETGHLNLDLPLPLELASRIDVLHGSGSTFFGSDAIGGAVNFVTERPDHSSASLRLGGGTLGSTTQHLDLTTSTPRFASSLAGDRDTSDGFFYAGQNDRGFHSNTLALDSFLTLHSALQPTEVLLGVSDRPYGANLFYGPYDSAERTKGWLALIRQPLPANLFADFAFRRHTDEFILEVNNPALYENNHIDILWQADLRRNQTLSPNLVLSYGLESDGDSIRSNSLGRHARNQGAGYASLNINNLRRLTLSIGAREEIYAGPRSVLSPNLSAGYFLGGNLHAHAALGHGFRLPTYVDLYYSDPVTIGNSHLQPETSQSYEGGLDWSSKLGTAESVRLSATGFTLRQSNAIDYSKYSLLQPWQAANVGHIAYTGVESAATFQLSSTEQLQLAETFTHASPPPPGLISEYAYNFASHNGSFAWQGIFPSAQLAARTAVSVVQQTARTAYPLWTVALSRSTGRVRPFARADNLANVSYSALPGVPLPGRVIMAGFVVDWRGR